jgi:signal transduction histidine kinase
VEADIELDGEIPGEQERVVYRLAQEALNNVVKHGAAKHASLTARLAEGSVRLVVQDDGSGFDTDAAAEGRGLTGMRERVAPLGGEIVVRSTPAGGTEVSATLPVLTG